MAFVPGVGSFPNNAAPVYGTPVYPSTLIAQQWNPFNNKQRPGPGDVTTGVSINTQHSGAWKSEVPVEGQVSLYPGSAKWTRFIEAGDQFWAMIPYSQKADIRVARQKAVAGFNHYTMNAWLREFHRKAMSKLVENPGALGASFLQQPEYLQSAKIRSELKSFGAMASNNEHLLYLAMATIMDTITYLGVNNTQSNELKSLDVKKGSISASFGEPMVVFSGRGPHRMRNLWGSNTLNGRHLWLILKRYPENAGPVPAEDNDGNNASSEQRIVAATLDRPFQIVPYVSDRWEATVPDSVRWYDGLGAKVDVDRETGNIIRVKGHYRERGHAFYVGMVVSGGRRTHVDSQPLQDAQGLAKLNDARDRVESQPSSNETSYEQTQALEYITVQVNPQAFGSFVNLA